jgi:hypothetical protein
MDRQTGGATPGHAKRDRNSLLPCSC